MNRFSIALALTLLGAPALAEESAIPAETVNQIMAMLSDIECQMSPDDIEKDGAGYELDDVICKGGHQFDIELDADLKEISRRAE